MKKPVLIKISLFLSLSIFLLSQVVVQSGCANIIPPEGGPKDTLPPKLVKASPPEFTTGFSSGRIIFTFNEYVDLDNYLQNLIVSPLPSNMPSVTRKLNVVTVKLRDTLQPNTTYSFDFGKAIKDVNEGNVMHDFTYTFSTGLYIDSLEFSGKVVLAETGESDSTLTVMLHQSDDDSAILKQRPRYVTKLDGKGNFNFRHLSPGKFYLYALKDEGGSYRYDKKKLFAFADSAIFISSETEPVTLYAYLGEKEDESASTAPTVPLPGASRNSRRGGVAADKRLRFQTNLKEGSQDLLDNFQMTFSVPLKDFDSSKVHFSADTTFTALSGYRLETDSTMKQATLTYTWKENTVYNLILEKEFATDTLDQQLLKTDTLTFRTKNIDDYGKLSIRLRNLDLSKNPVLLFVENEKVTHSFPLTSEVLTQTMFVPGEYSLRILFDENKNGKWDPGDFFDGHRQPEKVVPIGRKITIRPRWSNDFEISL
jgi:uncharacterized protein (DUF2141 family)